MFLGQDPACIGILISFSQIQTTQHQRQNRGEWWRPAFY